jgi:aryl-alcohol dehydrogenase-like predicted oxidoreductase
MSMAPGFYNPAPDRREMVGVIRGAHELGVTLFDTAEVYGPFISEEIVGEALQPIRNEVVLASKFGFSFDGGRTSGRNAKPTYLKERVDGMLRRLRTDRIDLLYLHRVDPATPIDETAGAVGELIQAGKVRAFGLSEVNPETLRRAHRVTPVAAVQSEYNVFERLPEVAMLDLCDQLNIGFVPWGPTMRGLTTDHLNAFSRFAPEDRRSSVPFFTPEALRTNMDVVRLLRRWADAKGVTPGQVSIAWLLAQKPFIVPIPGTTKLHHVRENVGAAALTFSGEEWARFRRELEALPVVGARPREAANRNE